MEVNINITDNSVEFRLQAETVLFDKVLPKKTMDDVLYYCVVLSKEYDFNSAVIRINGAEKSKCCKMIKGYFKSVSVCE